MELQELYSYIQKYQPNICQISVLQGGNEIYSAEWNGYQRTDCVHVASATKSVMALLIGIAIDCKMIGSVNDRVLSYFPEYPVKRSEKTIFDVTIRLLLAMRAPYKGHGEPWTKVCSGEDWTRASLDFLGGKGGITYEFDYRTVCLHILSGILFNATGMKTVDFTNEYLFCPLGIADHKNAYAGTAQEHKLFIMGKAPRKPVWLADPQGLAGSRLRAVSKCRRYGKARSALSVKRHMERAKDYFRRMASGNAFSVQDRKRHFQRKVLRLSLVERAPGKKCLCRNR